MKETLDSLVRLYVTLLEVSESIASHRDLSALMHDLAPRLHGLVEFDGLALLLYNPGRNTMRMHILEAADTKALRPGIELPAEETPAGWTVETQEPLLVSDVERESRFPRITTMMKADGVRSFCTLPLTSSVRRLGALGFASRRLGAYTREDVEFMRYVARQVAVAVDNVLHHEAAEDLQRQLQRKHDRLSLLLDINQSLVTILDRSELFRAISNQCRSAMQCDYVSLSLPDAESSGLRFYALDFPRGKGFLQEETLLPLEGSPSGEAFLSGKPVALNSQGMSQLDPAINPAVAEGIRSGCFLPLISRNRVLGTLNVGRLDDHPFSEDEVEFLCRVASHVAIAVENASAFCQIAGLKEKLAGEKLYLEDEIRTEHNFEEIIGESAALKKVLQLVETVATTPSTVLIHGETGTGKELIARAIHNLSSRRDRTFVKLNCAAIPLGLLESELFGHEKGAFTGAISQKIGRFELAHQGTLFLDEIGDIPLELQAKLLRVLQEQEFERLGGTRTIRVDVRLIAATNRDLTKMVAEKQFREDLYYRLNVFPIVVPPLRERREDIPLLVRYFVQQFARRADKRIETIPAETMEALVQWPWPGNIRELQNVIERAVILSAGSRLQVPLSDFKSPASSAAAAAESLVAVEKEHIVRTIRETRGQIGGPLGAAARLGMKRTTLQARMRKLGISRLGPFDGDGPTA
ncbi:MAG: sigma 54-interacting transcriptional regulator [Acidobacteriia bacterium]|nr:sigma 54-interacting transcriptional regulator [Terriglobia bacterium]